MLERRPNNNRFQEKLPSVLSTYKDAFSGPPWNQDLSDAEVESRILAHINRPGFTSFVVNGYEGDEVVGGLWYFPTSVDTLRSERGDALANFADSLRQETGIDSLVWEAEVLVRSDYRGKKLATRLRETFLDYLEDSYSQGVIMLTRMRDDNVGIIKIAENLEYQRSGLKVPSSQDPEIFHEYWYKIIDATTQAQSVETTIKDI